MNEFDPATLVQAEQVHRDLYLSPDIFTLEMQRLWARAWLFVGHDSQVPKAGPATPAAAKPAWFCAVACGSCQRGTTRGSAATSARL